MGNRVVTLVKYKIALILTVTIVVFSVFFSDAGMITVMAAGESLGDRVSGNVSAKLKGIDYYNDETIAGMLKPSRYSYIDISQKRREISDRDGRKFLDVTEDEAVAELNRDNLYAMDFGNSFNEVLGDIDNIVKRIVDNSEVPAGITDKESYFTDKIMNNKEKFLLGLAYIYRTYDFEMGGQSIRDILIYNPGIYGKNVDSIDWLIRIGGLGGDSLKLYNATNAYGYNKLFWAVASDATFNDFLKRNKEMFMPDKSLDEWFLENSKAYIIDKGSGSDKGLYSRMWDDANLKRYIIPMLNVSKDSIYVIANQATITFGLVDCYVDRNLKKTDSTLYNQKLVQFESDLESTAKQQCDYIELLKRIAGAEYKNELTSNRIVIDSLRIYKDITTDVRSEWSPKIGDTAATGVREFITPMGLYFDYTFVDGEATGTGIRMYISKALTNDGLSTYSHEMMHLLVKTVMLDGYGIRDGAGGEVYTRGMFETSESDEPPVFNFNFIYTNNEAGRFCNATPYRFESDGDIKAYMHGIMDVVYTLDYAEACAILEKSDGEKQKWFHKLTEENDTATRYNSGADGSRHNLDKVSEITLEEAGRLNSLEDLIDNNMIASRHEVDGLLTTGTFRYNGYYSVPLFASNYASVQNDEGVSGDLMIRRNAFELLAEFGYRKGLVPYLSNQYKADAENDNRLLSDTYILERIFDGRYASMSDFKKAMFSKRIQKSDKLKAVTIKWGNETVAIDSFEKMSELMKEAVEYDLKDVYIMPNGYPNKRAHQSRTELLKAEIYKAYMAETDEFRESIYTDGEDEEEPEEDPDKPGEDPDKPSEDPDKPGEDPDKPSEDPDKPSEDPNKPSENPDKPSEAPDKPGENPDKPSENPDKPEEKPNNQEDGVKDESSLSGNDIADRDDLSIMLAVGKQNKSNSIRLTWKKDKNAEGYEAYWSYCNGRQNFKKIKDIKAGTKLSCTHSGIKKNKAYKYFVTAYKLVGGKKVYISKSPVIHVAMKNEKRTNAKSIKVKKSKVTLKPGKSYTIKASVTKENKKKKLLSHADSLRYYTDDASVAVVSKKGKVTAKGKGCCNIYIVANNGVSKKINVVVK